MLSLRAKITLFGIVGVLVSVLVFFWIAENRRSEIDNILSHELDVLINDNLANIANNVHSMIAVQNANVQETLRANMKVAREILGRMGKISLDSQRFTVETTNQFNNQKSQQSIRMMLIGDSYVTINRDSSVPSPLVDEVGKMLGGTCTIFQRMNDQGDMLRVVTNVKDNFGNRAVGTYIPAVQPDGNPNPVLANVLYGKAFEGRALVVDKWCATIYEPIFDESQRVIGMLYVGMNEENIPQLRKAIMDILVGKTGYVFVIGGKGDMKGRYIISDKGQRDGENIWEAKDASGELFIQSMVKKALEKASGKVEFLSYPWKNVGESTARMKVAAIQYYEPWDWVIGAGAYVDDFTESKGRVADALSNLKRWIMLGGIIILVICGVAAFLFSGTISNPITNVVGRLESASSQIAAASEQLASASQTLSAGASEQAAGIEETSASLHEMSSMISHNSNNTTTANSLMDQTNTIVKEATVTMNSMVDSMKEIATAGEATSKIIKTIDEIAFQTNLLALNAAVEAARAGEAGAGFAVVADEVRNLAIRSAEAAKNTSELIESTVKKTKQGDALVTKTQEGFVKVTSTIEKTSGIMQEIAVASKEQATGISQVTTAMNEMEKAIQNNSATSEETAAAAEELNAQAFELKKTVVDLLGIIGTSHDSSTDFIRHGYADKAAHADDERHQTAKAKGHHVALKAQQAHKAAPAAGKIPMPDDDGFKDFSTPPDK